MTSMRDFTKRVLGFAPRSVYQAVRFASRLPIYFAEDRVYQRTTDRCLGHGTLAITDDISISLPSNRVANSVFRSMLFEASGRREWPGFLKLAQPCRSFIDIGASAGFFSVLFAASRPSVATPVTILSIDPDPACGPILEEMRQLHVRAGQNWSIDLRALGAEPGRMSFASSGFGGELVSPLRDNSAELVKTASANGLPGRMLSVEVTTLARICEQHAMVPDLIKIDIESYEHEVLHASLDFVKRTMPRLHLELHSGYLRERSVDPAATLRLLRDAGYRPGDGDAPTWDGLFELARRAFLLRTNLLPANQL